MGTEHQHNRTVDSQRQRAALHSGECGRLLTRTIAGIAADVVVLSNAVVADPATAVLRLETWVLCVANRLLVRVEGLKTTGFGW